MIMNVLSKVQMGGHSTGIAIGIGAFSVVLIVIAVFRELFAMFSTFSHSVRILEEIREDLRLIKSRETSKPLPEVAAQAGLPREISLPDVEKPSPELVQLVSMGESVGQATDPNRVIQRLRNVVTAAETSNQFSRSPFEMRAESEGGIVRITNRAAPSMELDAAVRISRIEVPREEVRRGPSRSIMNEESPTTIRPCPLPPL